MKFLKLLDANLSSEDVYYKIILPASNRNQGPRRDCATINKKNESQENSCFLLRMKKNTDVKVVFSKNEVLQFDLQVMVT